MPPLPYEKGPSDPNTFRVISQMSWRPCFCFFFYKTLHSTTGPRPSPRTMGVGPPRAGQPGGTRLVGKRADGEIHTHTTILLYTTSHASGQLDSCTQATQRVGTKSMWGILGEMPHKHRKGFPTWIPLCAKRAWASMGKPRKSIPTCPHLPTRSFSSD